VAKVKETVAALRGMRAKLPAGWHVTYSLQSQWPGGQECAMPTLVSEARRHAENIAAAMAARVGPIVALSDDLSVELSAIGTPAAMVGQPQLAMVDTVLTPMPACVAVVQFKLLR